ncbi:MAG: DNA-processing protein DprA [Gaiellaceae bacterium]
MTSRHRPYLTRRSRDYPPLLAAIPDPPKRLYLRGEGSPAMLSRPAAAIVGTRSCSPYGAQVARRLGRELAAAGATVISGLARGIDAEAHRGALEAGGPTVAVLGCGIDRDYPRAHSALARRVAEVGLLVSEYEPGIEPAPWRFPARNRIIAGLAQATVIVEARAKSGALITADFALEDGRDVFAVPGEITSALSRGTNELLRLGAAPLIEPVDVLAVLGLEEAPARHSLRLSTQASRVRELLADRSASVDELVARSGLAADAVAAALVELELAGEAVCAEGVYRAQAASGCTV